jgi:hypothetical protein
MVFGSTKYINLPVLLPRMKWLILFLSFVVMAGSFMPCCPLDNYQEEITSGKQQGHEKGMCSPFFACGSCAGFVQLAKHVSVPVLSVEQTVHHERIATSFVSGYYSSFFQPPRSS